MPFLEIHDADGVTTMPLEGEELVIGRLPTAGLVIDSRSCSKSHCRLEKRGRTWRAVDLASANGTTVNGNAISQVVLEDGDEIAIGAVTLVFRRGAVAAPRGEDGEAVSAAGPTGRRKNRTPLVAGLVVVLAVAGFAIFSGDPAAPPRQDAVVEGDDEERADAEVSTPADGAPALHDTVSARFESLRGRDDMAFDDLEYALDELAAEATGIDLRREINAFRGGARERFERAYREELSAVTGKAADLALRGDFGIALDGLQAFIVEAEAVGAERVATDARRERLEIVKQARDDWDALRREVSSLSAQGKFDEARAGVRERIDDFRGTRFEAFAHSELQLIDLSASLAARKEAGAADEAESDAERDRHAAVALIGDAEKLAAERHWAAAGVKYAEALALVDDPDLAARWTRRRDILDALGHLKAVVIANVNDEGKAVRTVRIGRLTARPARADDETVELTFGRTGLVAWKWKEIPADQLVDLLSFGVRRGEPRFAFALACHEFGQRERGVEVLAEAAEESALKVRADRVYAAWRGMDVPPGGFIVEDGAFYTFEEHQKIEMALRARRLSKSLVRASSKKFDEIAFELKEMGGVAHDAFQAALRERYVEVFERFDQLAVVKRVSTVRSQLRDVADERREKAFELIFDTKRYPYPYGPDQEKVQGEVNALVARVREVYEHPSRELLEASKGLAELDTELRSIIAFMHPVGDAPVPDGDALLTRLDALIDMRTHSLSKNARKVSEEALRFNAEIKSSITAEERELHRLTNEYRMMMGRQAVKIDEALVRAARSHSQEMKDLGYFAHDSPVKERRTPSMRARLAGWGGGCSENIARGSPTPALALRGWINSSGHHRNVLGRGHTHLGCGKAKDGAFWTQNFATGSSSPLSREKIDPDDAGDDDQKR